MADNSGGNSFLGLIVGALLVVVAIGGYFLYTGGNFGGGNDLTVKVDAPAIDAPKVPTGN